MEWHGTRPNGLRRQPTNPENSEWGSQNDNQQHNPHVITHVRALMNPNSNVAHRSWYYLAIRQPFIVDSYISRTRTTSTTSPRTSPSSGSLCADLLSHSRGLFGFRRRVPARAQARPVRFNHALHPDLTRARACTAAVRQAHCTALHYITLPCTTPLSTHTRG